MFDEKTILARLANGEDAGVIANEFAAMLNATLDAHRKANQEREIEARKNALAEQFANVLYDYMTLELPELADLMADEDIDLTSIARQSMDSVAHMMRHMIDVYDEHEDCSSDCDCHSQAEPTGPQVVIQEKRNNEPAKTRVVTGADADAIIDKFLKKFGL